jgi:phosphotransferase system  glucose/maltose/N-acetylglucosamine-specific IIC component
MKTFLQTLVALMIFTGVAHAQYAIDWFTIDGGGGTSSGGNYTLSGTIGQPDAGRLSGGSYTLEGGFWPGLVVPSTGEAPTLFIQLSGANVIISWAPSTSGFSLEQSSTFLPLSWIAAPSGTTNSATIPLGSGPTFYRLQKP